MAKTEEFCFHVEVRLLWFGQWYVVLPFGRGPERTVGLCPWLLPGLAGTRHHNTYVEHRTSSHLRIMATSSRCALWKLTTAAALPNTWPYISRYSQQFSSTDHAAMTLRAPSLGSAGTQRCASGISSPPVSRVCCARCVSWPCWVACSTSALACTTGCKAEQHSIVSMKPLALLWPKRLPSSIGLCLPLRSLHGFEPRHGQSFAGAPLSVGLLPVHEWPSESLSEVLVALCNQEVGGCIRWPASMQLIEGLWSLSQDFRQRHRVYSWTWTQNSCMLQHAQALEAGDISAGQSSVWPLCEDHGHRQEGNMHAACYLSDRSTLEFAHVDGKWLQPLKQCIDCFVAGCPSCCKVGHCGHGPP